LKISPRLKTIFPFSGKFHTLASGHRLHYLDEGKASTTPATLFLHGNPTWSFFYRNLLSAWSGQGRCIAPDHLGCGLSDKPPVDQFPYTLESHALNLRTLIDSLDIEEFNLVVHDWGGAIGLTAFRDCPERVKKVVLLNTAAFPSPDVPKRILFCRTPILGSLFVRGLNGFALPATWMASTRGLTPDAKYGLLYPYNSWANRVAVWRFVKDIPHENNHPSLSILKETENSLQRYLETPALACWGMDDFCFHEGFLKQWESHWPHLQSHRLSQTGHYLLEDNLEECRSLIEPFLFT